MGVHSNVLEPYAEFVTKTVEEDGIAFAMKHYGANLIRGGFCMYTHRVQYYETDQMGIVHHSNYIRWFEEARIDWMRHCGISYREMEKTGHHRSGAWS